MTTEEKREFVSEICKAGLIGRNTINLLEEYLDKQEADNK